MRLPYWKGIVKMEEMAITPAKTEEMAVTPAKTEEMAVTPAVDDSSDDDWDEEKTTKGPIVLHVVDEVYESEPESESDVLTQVSPSAQVVKTKGPNLRRQNWKTFVNFICSKRSTPLPVSEDNAHSATWAKKNFTPLEYYFWVLGYRKYHKDSSRSLDIPKTDTRVRIDEEFARFLHGKFTKLFPGSEFWATSWQYKDFKAESVQSFYQ